MERLVYVDWDKIELLIKTSEVDLAGFGGSEIVYLSQKTGRPWSTIKRVKSERTTTLKTIGEIAQALECNPVDIISAQGYPAPKSEALAALSITESLSAMGR